MGRRAKTHAVELLPTAKIPTIEVALELVVQADAAHRARRHHLASRYLEAALGILNRLRAGVESSRVPGLDRTTTGVRHAVVRVVRDLEPRAFGLVRIADVRETMGVRHDTAPQLVDATLRDLERRCVLSLAVKDATDESGLWINGRGWQTHVCRARAYWHDTGRPYDD